MGDELAYHRVEKIRLAKARFYFKIAQMESQEHNT